MNTLQFELFLEAARELNFTKAAKNKFMSQQALSHHISKLEKEYGTTLFERSTPLKLTEAGKKMVEYSNRILNLERQINSEIHDIKEETVGELHIGVGRERGEILRYILPKFHQAFPKVRVICHEAFNSQLAEMLSSGQINLFISSKPADNIFFQSEISAKDWLALVISANLLQKCCPHNYGYILGNRYKKLPFSLFIDCPLVLTDTRSKTRQLADAFFYEYNYTPKVMLEAGYTESVFSLITTGSCAAICFAQPAADRLNQLLMKPEDEVFIFKIENLSVDMNVCLTYDKRKYISLAQNYFMQLLRDNMSQHYILQTKKVLQT